MCKYRFSVFTATFNRGSLLANVYKCLLRQTYKDFEWVIIDDGSTDNTEQIVKSFINEHKLNIKYHKKENGGKHSAWKIGTKLFEGKYEIGADDDDIFPDNTLEIFDKQWSILEQDENYDHFWEIRGRCVDSFGNLIGPKFNTNYFDSDYNDFCYVLRYGTIELQGCRKVSVLKNEAAVPDNILFGEYITNFPEMIRWSRAARKYKTRFISSIVRIYNDTPNSLIKSANTITKYYNNT